MNPPPEGVGLHKIQIVGDQRDAWLNLLVRAKHREWMGCWGVLGLLIVSQWIINIYIHRYIYIVSPKIPYLRLAPVSSWYIFMVKS